MFLMLLRDQTMDYKETKNVVEGLCEWEILDLENVKYLNFFKMSIMRSLICLGLIDAQGIKLADNCFLHSLRMYHCVCTSSKQ